MWRGSGFLDIEIPDEKKGTPVGIWSITTVEFDSHMSADVKYVPFHLGVQL